MALQITRRGRLVACTLTRPAALNALNFEMVCELRGLLAACASERDECRVLLVEGAGGKAFCCGGDVKAVAQDALAGGSLARSFFADEYALNAELAEFPKTQVSVWDGVVMGGGAGLSVHGKFRVATERTVFAMPEAAIGFFPDVGASHFLNALPGRAGTFLGLTGARIGARDACRLGLATHFVPSARVPELEEALSDCGSAQDVDARLRALGRDAEPPPAMSAGHSLELNAPAIERCFGAGSVREIVAALELEQSEWATATLGTLRKLSPTSLVAILHLLRQSEGRPLRDCLAREYELAQKLTALPANGSPPSDFFEGIRAVLVDKDQKPAWRPATVEELDVERVVAHLFGPLSDSDIAGTVASLRGPVQEPAMRVPLGQL
ncbi:enoyl-CoA hydratase/carnithine racemase [Pavlovales sp. CCMP2436]|nr:enoyl-CoA hydratase/carnithine racemase [Pavlovales sp. CCMP2436]